MSAYDYGEVCDMDISDSEDSPGPMMPSDPGGSPPPLPAAPPPRPSQPPVPPPQVQEITARQGGTTGTGTGNFSKPAGWSNLPKELMKLGWRKLWSKQKQRPYFFNKKTKKAAWKMPEIPQKDSSAISSLIDAYGSSDEEEEEGRQSKRKGKVAAPPEMLRLVVLQSTAVRSGTLFTTGRSNANIGRLNQPITIQEVAVSKVHSEIQYNEKTHQFMVRDVGSMNGTFLNGTRLAQPKKVSGPFPISHGDELKVGNTVMQAHVHPGNDSCFDCRQLTDVLLGSRKEEVVREKPRLEYGGQEQYGAAPPSWEAASAQGYRGNAGEDDPAESLKRQVQQALDALKAPPEAPPSAPTFELQQPSLAPAPAPDISSVLGLLKSTGTPSSQSSSLQQSIQHVLDAAKFAPQGAPPSEELPQVQQEIQPQAHHVAPAAQSAGKRDPLQQAVLQALNTGSKTAPAVPPTDLNPPLQQESHVQTSTAVSSIDLPKTLIEDTSLQDSIRKALEAIKSVPGLLPQVLPAGIGQGKDSPVTQVEQYSQLQPEPSKQTLEQRIMQLGMQHKGERMFSEEAPEVAHSKPSPTQQPLLEKVAKPPKVVQSPPAPSNKDVPLQQTLSYKVERTSPIAPPVSKESLLEQQSLLVESVSKTVPRVSQPTATPTKPPRSILKQSVQPTADQEEIFPSQPKKANTSKLESPATQPVSNLSQREENIVQPPASSSVKSAPVVVETVLVKPSIAPKVKPATSNIDGPPEVKPAPPTDAPPPPLPKVNAAPEVELPPLPPMDQDHRVKPAPPTDQPAPDVEFPPLPPCDQDLRVRPPPLPPPSSAAPPLPPTSAAPPQQTPYPSWTSDTPATSTAQPPAPPPAPPFDITNPPPPPPPPDDAPQPPPPPADTAPQPPPPPPVSSEATSMYQPYYDPGTGMYSQAYMQQYPPPSMASSMAGYDWAAAAQWYSQAMAYSQGYMPNMDTTSQSWAGAGWQDGSSNANWQMDMSQDNKEGMPPDNQMADTPDNQMGGPPDNQMPSGNQLGGPPGNQMDGPNKNQMGGPPGNRMGGPPGNQMGGPEGNQMGGNSDNQMGGPPGNQIGRSNKNQFGGPPVNRMDGPNKNQMGGPPGNWMGGPQGNQMGGPNMNQMGRPQGNQMGGPQGNQMGGPPGNRMDGPQGNWMGGPPGNQMGGPPNNRMGMSGNNQMGMPQGGQNAGPANNNWQNRGRLSDMAGPGGFHDNMEGRPSDRAGPGGFHDNVEGSWTDVDGPPWQRNQGGRRLVLEKPVKKGILKRKNQQDDSTLSANETPLGPPPAKFAGRFGGSDQGGRPVPFQPGPPKTGPAGLDTFGSVQPGPSEDNMDQMWSDFDNEVTVLEQQLIAKGIKKKPGDKQDQPNLPDTRELVIQSLVQMGMPTPTEEAIQNVLQNEALVKQIQQIYVASTAAAAGKDATTPTQEPLPPVQASVEEREAAIDLLMKLKQPITDESIEKILQDSEVMQYIRIQVEKKRALEEAKQAVAAKKGTSLVDVDYRRRPTHEEEFRRTPPIPSERPSEFRRIAPGMRPEDPGYGYDDHYERMRPRDRESYVKDWGRGRPPPPRGREGDIGLRKETVREEKAEKPEDKALGSRRGSFFKPVEGTKKDNVAAALYNIDKEKVKGFSTKLLEALKGAREKLGEGKEEKDEQDKTSSNFSEQLTVAFTDLKLQEEMQNLFHSCHQSQQPSQDSKEPTQDANGETLQSAQVSSTSEQGVDSQGTLGITQQAIVAFTQALTPHLNLPALLTGQAGQDDTTLKSDTKDGEEDIDKKETGDSQKEDDTKEDSEGGQSEKSDKSSEDASDENKETKDSEKQGKGSEKQSSDITISEAAVESFTSKLIEQLSVLNKEIVNKLGSKASEDLVKPGPSGEGHRGGHEGRFPPERDPYYQDPWYAPGHERYGRRDPEWDPYYRDQYYREQYYREREMYYRERGARYPEMDRPYGRERPPADEPKYAREWEEYERRRAIVRRGNPLLDRRHEDHSRSMSPAAGRALDSPGGGQRSLSKSPVRELQRRLGGEETRGSLTFEVFEYITEFDKGGKEGARRRTGDDRDGRSEERRSRERGDSRNRDRGRSPSSEKSKSPKEDGKPKGKEHSFTFKRQQLKRRAMQFLQDYVREKGHSISVVVLNTVTQNEEFLLEFCDFQDGIMKKSQFYQRVQDYVELADIKMSLSKRGKKFSSLGRDPDAEDIPEKTFGQPPMQIPGDKKPDNADSDSESETEKDSLRRQKQQLFQKRSNMIKELSRLRDRLDRSLDPDEKAELGSQILEKETDLQNVKADIAKIGEAMQEKER
ncbi:uncharacterized protein [Branchiostoma lanceolatum]|uniref:uncharacterized protein isoform X2 n=1 Tax=Branchiostoma lanceolatum TaxID=7740 RepID=UPI0034553551